MKSYLKFLSRNILYTTIEVFGLAIALMFILIIAKYAKNELSIDKFHENADNIYVLANEEFIGSAYGLSGKLLERYPEIEQICATRYLQKLHAEIQDKGFDPDAMAVDSTIFSMFSFELLEGNRNEILTTTDKVLISESFANNAFQGESPVGKSISIDWGDEKVGYIISGVFKKIENSVIKNCDLMINMQLVGKYLNPSISNDNFNNAAGVNLFILKNPESNLVSITDDMLQFFKEHYWVYKNGNLNKVILIPLQDIYFSSILQASGDLNQGNKQFVFILSGVALFILLFALINYINLTVAQTGFRAKEMSMRQLLGSSKAAVVMRFIGEAVALTVVALLLGIFFAKVVEPYTLALLGRKVDLFENIAANEIVFSILLVVGIGTLAGLIPAMMISRYKPIDVVKGTFRLNTKMVMGKVFVVIQNVVTITMLAMTLTLYLQFNYLMDKPLGYDTKNIMSVSIPLNYRKNDDNADNMARYNMLKDEIAKIPNVKRVGLAQGHPLSSFNNWTFVRDGENVSVMFLQFDSTAFDILHFEVLQQNQIPMKGRYWLTESATRKLHVDYDVTEISVLPEQDFNMDVCGIIKDYNKISGLHDDSQDCNVIVMLDGEPWNIIIETSDMQMATKEAVENRMQELTNVECKGEYLHDILYERYNDQKNILNIVLIFSIVAIIISTLGLIAMSMYYTRQRMLEVAVRKVFGSTNGEMFSRLAGSYMKLLLISFAISVPIAWYLVDYWLKDYSYRISISPFIFIAAGVVAMLIAAAAISWQSWRAANANPVESLKKE